MGIKEYYDGYDIENPHKKIDFPQDFAINPKSKEIMVCISHKGNSIGFASVGDYEEDVDLNFEFFEKHNCNICVTARRTRGGSRQALYAWAKGKKGKKVRYDISTFDFDRSDNDEGKANEEKATLMLSRLSHLISKNK